MKVRSQAIKSQVAPRPNEIHPYRRARRARIRRIFYPIEGSACRLRPLGVGSQVLPCISFQRILQNRADALDVYFMNLVERMNRPGTSGVYGRPTIPQRKPCKTYAASGRTVTTEH